MNPATRPLWPSDEGRHRRGHPWRLLSGLAAILVFGSFLPGEPGEFVRAGWTLVPFVLLGVAAQQADRSGLARLAAVGLALGIVGMIAMFNGLTVLVDAPKSNERGLLALGIGMTTLTAGCVFGAIGASRRPVSPGVGATAPGGTRWIHTFAAAFASAMTAALLIPLAATGSPPITRLFASPKAAAELLGERGVPGMLADELYGLTWTLAGAAFVVGYGIHRDGRQVLDRLGLTGFRIRIVVAGIFGAALLRAGGFVLDPLFAAVWTTLGWPQTDVASLEPIFGPLSTPIGAVVVGICAGLGEEVSIRGILQPRIGVLSANLLFTALHAYQYHWDGLLGVFLIGLVLGWIRRRWNTAAAAIAHGTYNFTLLLEAWLERGGG